MEHWEGEHWGVEHWEGSIALGVEHWEIEQCERSALRVECWKGWSIGGRGSIGRVENWKDGEGKDREG